MLSKAARTDLSGKLTKSTYVLCYGGEENGYMPRVLLYNLTQYTWEALYLDAGQDWIKKAGHHHNLYTLKQNYDILDVWEQIDG